MSFIVYPNPNLSILKVMERPSPIMQDKRGKYTSPEFLCTSFSGSEIRQPPLSRRNLVWYGRHSLGLPTIGGPPSRLSILAP
jgi:hypothetical protein